MKLYFMTGLTSEIVITKDGRKWMYFYAESNHCNYRVDKKTGEVQIGPYWETGKGMYLKKGV